MIPRSSTRRDQNGWEFIQNYGSVPDFKTIERKNAREEAAAAVAVPRRRKSVAELLLPKRKASVSTCFVPKFGSTKNIGWTPTPAQQKMVFSHSLLCTLREDLEEETKKDDDTAVTEETIPRRPPRRQNGIVRSPFRPKGKRDLSSIIQRIEWSKI